MELNKLLPIILSITLTGCVTPKVNLQKQLNRAEIYEQGYRDGVSERIEGVLEESEGRTYLNPAIWHEPVVQYVEFEAQIKNGAYYRKRKEPVIIIPGQWKTLQDSPKNTDKEEKVQNEQTNIYENDDVSVSNITVLPTQHTGEPDYE